MIPALVDAGVALAALLEEENRALSALDLAAAAALAERKRSAVDRFVAAEQTLRKAKCQTATREREAVKALGEQLSALAATNQRMLERALAAQDGVVRLLVEALRPADGRYIAPGAQQPRRHDAPALTLSARL